MQQQQNQVNQQIYNSFPDESQLVLLKLLEILQNKQRKQRAQFEKKNKDDEKHFDTLIEGKENGSQFSQLSQNSSCQTYISINFSDEDSQILQKILKNLLKENLIQFSDYEKNQKGLFDSQNQNISSVIVPNNNIDFDIVQPIQQQVTYEEKNTSKQKKRSKSPNKQNPKQILKSLIHLQKKYQQYLNEIKPLVNKMILKNQTDNPQLQYSLQLMNNDRIILNQCREIMDENEQTFKQYDQEIQVFNQLQKK